jgi:O-antigen/teichoic acid export membrane protein
MTSTPVPAAASAAASAEGPATASRSRLAGVARGSTANLLGAAVSAASTLGVTLAVTRGLPQQRAGVFFAATSLFMLATVVGQLGTNTGLVFFLAKARAQGVAGARELLYRTAARPVLVVAGLMAVALLVFAPEVSALVNPRHVEESTAYLRMLAVFIPLAGLENVTLAGTRGLGTMRPNVVTEQLGRPTLQLLLVVVSVTVFGGRGLGLAWVVCYLPAAVLAFAYWRRLGGAADRRAAQAQVAGEPGSGTVGDSAGAVAGQRREFWRFTAPRAAASVAQMAMQRLDIVLVAALAGAVPAAIYTAATRFLVVGQMGQRAISLAVQPRLGEALALHDTALGKQLYRVSTSWLMLVTWPTYLTFCFFGEQLLGLFGHDYAAGRDVLLLLAGIMLFATGCGMVDMVLNMAGRTSWNLMNVGLSLGVQICVDLWLIPDHGILGAAIGWAAGIVLANLVPLVQVGAVVGLHPFGRTTLAAVLSTVGCFAAVPAVVIALLGPGWVSLAVSLSVGCSLYAVALWRLRRVLYLTELASISRRRRRR